MTQRPLAKQLPKPLPNRLRKLMLTGAALSTFALAGCAEDSSTATAAAGNAASGQSVAAASSGSTASDTVAAALPEVTGEETYSSVWGPKIGTRIPLLAANDHAGQPQSLESLSGGKGLLLVFSRSADW